MIRTIAAVFLVAALAGPAHAAPAVLTSGGLSGSCSGTEISAPFTVPAASLFSLQSAFSGAAGTITLTTSTDNGQTFAPLSVNGRALSVISATDKPFWAGAAGSDSRFLYVQNATAQYRVECNVSGTTTSWSIALNTFSTTSSVYTLGRPLNDYVRFRSTITYTDAQAQNLYLAKFTPLSASDLSNMTAGYRLGIFDTFDTGGNPIKANAYIKLSLSSSPPPILARSFRLGEWRLIYAQSATVASITDGNGNAVSSAYAPGVPRQVYTVGQTAPSDSSCCAEIQPDAFSNAGVHFWPTLTEAIDGSGIYPGTSAPNLTALGL